jgi:hypothetical protein
VSRDPTATAGLYPQTRSERNAESGLPPGVAFSKNLIPTQPGHLLLRRPIRPDLDIGEALSRLEAVATPIDYAETSHVDDVFTEGTALLV